MGLFQKVPDHLLYKICITQEILTCILLRTLRLLPEKIFLERKPETCKILVKMLVYYIKGLVIVVHTFPLDNALKGNCYKDT